MLRVPANVPKSEPRSLEQARAAGGDVRPDRLPARSGADRARATRTRSRVLRRRLRDHHGAGGRRCSPRACRRNLSVLLSGRLTWPAVAMLLEQRSAGLRRTDRARPRLDRHGPGGMGVRAARQHDMPAAVAGFEPRQPAGRALFGAAPASRGPRFLDNCYPQRCQAGRQSDRAPAARRNRMDVVDANWRGIGMIPRSGFALEAGARRLTTPCGGFGLDADAARKRAGEMPPGCDCARVVLGQDLSERVRAVSAAPARRATRSARAWFRTKAPAASGGRRACADSAIGRCSTRRELRWTTGCAGARGIVVGGRVQGVGFRPFVYRTGARAAA